MEDKYKGLGTSSRMEKKHSYGNLSVYHRVLKYFIQTMPHGCTFIILHILPSIPFYITSHDIQLLLCIGRYQININQTPKINPL